MTLFQPKASSLPVDEISYPRDAANKILRDVLSVLFGDKGEKFEYERAMRLFQFQTWIFAPTMESIRYAGLIAATKIARTIELTEYLPMYDSEDYLPKMTLERLFELRQKRPSYWSMYNNIIAAGGGLPALLEAPTPALFDSVMTQQRTKAKIVADLVDYRFRYALYGQDGASGANINHAIFFNWWPTHDIPGKRGITVKNKSVSAKTMRNSWDRWKRSAIFIYLHVKHGFSQSLPDANVEPTKFVDVISDAAKNVDELRQLFGAYAYIAEAINRATGERPYITVPKEFPRITISVAPFSDIEQQTMAQYAENNLDMWQ
jgi:hypothetical protein